MIADIAHGHVDGADVCFLIAVILAALATILFALGHSTTPPRHAVWAPVLGWAAVTLLALGWLIL